MTDEIKKRPWWKKKTNMGLILLGISKTMTFFEVTAPFSPALEAIGMILAGYGIADRVSSNKK